MAVLARQVNPWCTLTQHTAYVITPQPADWFVLVPRYIAEDVLKGPYARYWTCTRKEEMYAHQAQCCGGGPTAQIFGAIMKARVPVVGAAYTGSKWGAAPPGSYEIPNMWPMVVLRDTTHNDWCDKNTPLNWLPGVWKYLADKDMCLRLVDPEHLRNRPLGPGLEWAG